MLFVTNVIESILQHAITAVLISLDVNSLTAVIIYHIIKALMTVYHLDFDPFILIMEEQLMTLINLYYHDKKQLSQSSIFLNISGIINQHMETSNDPTMQYMEHKVLTLIEAHEKKTKRQTGTNE